MMLLTVDHCRHDVAQSSLAESKSNMVNHKNAFFINLAKEDNFLPIFTDRL